MDINNRQNTSDAYDSPWKEMLEHAFLEFMAFYFPEAYTQIDWARGHEFKRSWAVAIPWNFPSSSSSTTRTAPNHSQQTPIPSPW